MEAQSSQCSKIMIEVEHCIRNALLREVYTTPKPGLVDLHDTGAHRDMNVSTFTESARAISPYILQMFYCGIKNPNDPEQVFAEIRQIGICAEDSMFRATNGVNTHKGILFTMGILAAAGGICVSRTGRFDTEQVLEISREMTENPLTKELYAMKSKAARTHGELLYQKYGEEGIRGEARRGFPILQKSAYPVLKEYREAGYDQNLSQINVLLHIMENLTDTNILSRGTIQDLEWVQHKAKEILSYGGAFSKKGFDMICRMNRECVMKNLSPGGAADMLAAAIFLYEMEALF